MADTSPSMVKYSSNEGQAAHLDLTMATSSGLYICKGTPGRTKQHGSKSRDICKAKHLTCSFFCYFSLQLQRTQWMVERGGQSSWPEPFLWLRTDRPVQVTLGSVGRHSPGRRKQQLHLLEMGQVGAWREVPRLFSGINLMALFPLHVTHSAGATGLTQSLQLHT